MIEVCRLGFTYAGAASPALEQVDLQIHRGDLLIVTGSSGSGKSTLLRAFNGLVPHFHGGTIWGTVTVDGIDTMTTHPRQLADRIGFVGQDPEDHGVTDTVIDDISFTLENLDMAPATIRKRTEEVMDALEVAHLRDRKLDSLSGGERQRAAIASALVAMPRFLVLDEPTSQLDPQSAEQVLSALLRLRDELGVAVVISEHRLERVIAYADSMAHMRDGRITSGTVTDVLEVSELGPPIVELGRRLGWRPVALELRDARRRIHSIPVNKVTVPRRRSTGDRLAKLDGMRVVLGGHPALRDVDLDISQGEVVAIMGRNGSGKTTLLRSIAGLAKPTKGDVRLAGSVGMVPQDASRVLFRDSLRAEIRATLKGRKLNADTADIEALARSLGVTHLLDRYPRDLSGGERTSAAIAACLAGIPDLVLLDEPTRGMDAASKRSLAGSILDWAKRGSAVVIATHDVELAAIIATRVVLLAQGSIVADGPPEETLSSSITFSTQMNKVFEDPGILTVQDACRAVGVSG